MSINLQEWITSTPGQIVTVVAILIVFSLILISGKQQKINTKVLVVSGVLVALGVALSALKLYTMPQGGSVTPLSLLPIVLAGYFYGVRRGMMVGICVGLLNLLLNPYVIHPVQLLLDYPIAFGALAFGAVFRNKGKYSLIITYIVGVLSRYICAVLSGIIFFGDIAPEGFNAVTWSLWYNLTYLGVEGAITVVLLLIPVVKTTFERLKEESLAL